MSDIKKDFVCVVSQYVMFDNSPYHEKCLRITPENDIQILNTHSHCFIADIENMPNLFLFCKNCQKACFIIIDRYETN